MAKEVSEWLDPAFLQMRLRRRSKWQVGGALMAPSSQRNRLTNQSSVLNVCFEMADMENAGELGTRERILDAAEALFGEEGFEGVSLRDITGRADANVASVNYHFGSKENLITAVVERHARPINEERLRCLDAAEARHADRAVPVEQVLEAFLVPMIEHIEKGRMSEGLFCKFMGRLMAERTFKLPSSVEPLFQEMAARFAKAFMKAVPDISEQEALWRMHYSFGVMANTLMHGETLQQISAGRAGAPTIEEQMRHIIKFCTAGFRASSGPGEGGGA
jgi:AcrR family transcriptional regulator